MRCIFPVTSLSFVNQTERNEKQRKASSPPVAIPATVSPDINVSKNKKGKESEKSLDKHDMICLSNLEEVVFYTCTSQCLLHEIKASRGCPVDYDKYLDYFE